MRRRIVMILLVLLCFFLQGTLFKSLSFAAVTPNLLMVLTVSFALMRGKKEGMFLGFLGGIIIDLFFSEAIGFYALIYTCIGYLNGYCYRIFYDDDVKLPVFLTAASTFGYGIIVYIFQFLMRGRVDVFYYLGRIIVPEVIFTMIITMVFYRLLYLLNRKLEKAEQRSVDSFV